MQQRTHKIGLDANRPLDKRGEIAARLVDPDIIAGTGAAWIRINFVLGPWSSPHERAWIALYDRLIDQYLAKGMNIYGLIGHEAVNSSLGLPDFFREPRGQTSDRTRAEQWLAAYVDNFVEIVHRFQPRVKVFESFNEPDDWHGQNRPWIDPSWFAVMLDQIYHRVKTEAGFDDVVLISGPLQGLEVNRNEGPTRYLQETYQYGRKRLGWDGHNRPYPFDGVGYHLYIKEGYNPDWAGHEQEVRQTYRQYVNGMQQVIRQAEGAAKPLYISEIGWPSNADTPQAKEFQARNLSLALELLAADPAVALGVWFCTEDFDPPNKLYGLYQPGNLTLQGRKPAYYAYKDFCDRLAAAPRPAPQLVMQPATPRPEPRQASWPTPVFIGHNPGGGKTIKQQLAELHDQISALRAEAGLPALPPLKGAIRQQLDQLRAKIISLRPEAAEQLSAEATGPLTQQLAYLRNLVAQLEDQSASQPERAAPAVGDQRPLPPPPGPPPAVPIRPLENGLTIKQQIAAFRDQIAALYAQAGRPAPGPLGATIRRQLAQLRDQLVALRPELSAPFEGAAAESIRRQLTQLRHQLAQLDSETSPPAPAGQPEASRPDRPPAPAESSRPADRLPTQLQNQLSQLQSALQNLPAQLKAIETQVQRHETQIAQLQQYIQQVVIQQAVIKKELQAAQTRLETEPGQSSLVPGGAPRPDQAPPPIQNITDQLPRHPTRRFPSRSLNEIEKIIVHDTGIDSRYGAERIAAYRVNNQEWPGIGYHFFITQEGVIQQTNELATVSTHTHHHNQASVGVAFAGGFDQVAPSATQIEAGAQAIAWLLNHLGLTGQQVYGYKEVADDRSPGAQWDSGAQWGQQLRNRIQAYL